MIPYLKCHNKEIIVSGRDLSLTFSYQSITWSKFKYKKNKTTKTKEDPLSIFILLVLPYYGKKKYSFTFSSIELNLYTAYNRIA